MGQLQTFSNLGFAKTYVLPAALIFVVPILSLLFFLHAQSLMDDRARESILNQIRSDPSISGEERAKMVEFFTVTPFSKLMTDEKFAKGTTANAHFNFSVFRWMIRLSLWSIIAGISVFLLACVCVLASLRSQFVQYVSLSIGWHVLRIYGAFQTIAIAILLVALSYWVTAIWFSVYSVKLILLAGLLAVVGVIAVLVAIFKNPRNEFVVEGALLDQDSASELWRELKLICEKVRTSPPTQVIAGIDDNFYVTEHPVTVGDKKYTGKTLFVSLPLLKQLHANEADAILAHEMAHFSGNDTLFSKRISPLLNRYHNYLNGLYHGTITLPVYCFMLCFLAMFELSIRKLKRERELRADSIAASIASPQNFVSALLRIVAYSKFRASVESDLFQHERVMETVDVAKRVELEFPQYATQFSADPELVDSSTAHPFDTHPPVAERIAALGMKVDTEQIREMLSTSGDGGWFQRVSNATELESQQWKAYEDVFRARHEFSLAYRFLPESPEEQAIVEKAFPAQTLNGKEGDLCIDFEKINFSKWTAPIRYRDISKCTLKENGELEIEFKEPIYSKSSFNTQKFQVNQQDIVGMFQQYYGRHLGAVEFRKQMKAADKPVT